MNPLSTCDLCDAHKTDTSGAFRVLPPVFQAYGGRAAFAGPVATVKCHEDNTSVKAMVESEVWLITRDSLDNLFAANPKVAYRLVSRIATCLSKRLRQMNDKLTDLANR